MGQVDMKIREFLECRYPEVRSSEDMTRAGICLDTCVAAVSGDGHLIFYAVLVELAQNVVELLACELCVLLSMVLGKDPVTLFTHFVIPQGTISQGVVELHADETLVADCVLYQIQRAVRLGCVTIRTRDAVSMGQFSSRTELDEWMDPPLEGKNYLPVDHVYLFCRGGLYGVLEPVFVVDHQRHV